MGNIILRVTIFLTILVGVLSQDKSKCKVEEADRCASQIMMVGDRSFRPPATESEMISLCRKNTANIKCVRDYARGCLDPFPRQLVTTMIPAMTKTIKGFCRAGSQRKEFIEKSKCAEKPEFGSVHQCVELAIAKIQLISNETLVRPIDQIPASCCLYHDLSACLHERTKANCGAKGEDTAEYFGGMLTTTVGDMMDLVCSRYESQEKCVEALPKIVGLFREMEKKHAGKPAGSIPINRRSILLPFVDLFSRLSD